MHRTERYLAELERRLEKQVPPERRAEIIAELRSHLHFSALAEMEMGCTKAEAEARAMKQLGATASIAEDLALQLTGRSNRSAWHLAAVPFALDGVAHYVIPLAIALLPISYQSTSPYLAMLWTAPFVLVTFIWSAMNSRRWLMGPMIASLFFWWTLSLVVASSTPFRSAVVSAVKVSGGDPEGKEYKAMLEKRLALARDGVAGLQANPARYRADGAARYSGPMEIDVYSRIPAPFLPTLMEGPHEKRMVLNAGMSYEEALVAWEKSGASYRRELERERDRAGQLPSLQQLIQGSYWGMLCIGGLRLMILAFANLLVLAFFSARRRIRDRKEPLSV